MGRKDRKAIAVAMFIFVGLVLVVMIQSENVVALDSSFIKNIKCYDGNECLTIFEIPNILTTEEQELVDQVAGVFYQDDLPPELQAEAVRQVEGQRQLLEEQNTDPSNPDEINQVTQGNDTGILHVSGVSLGLGDPSVTGLTLIEKQTTPNVFQRGDVVKVVGKMQLNKPAPYFFNVNITCCGMNSFKVMSAVETDAVGNFKVKFVTSSKYPLGDYTVELGVIGDDNKILKHVYEFRLFA